ncbi:MAG: hypothetical protein HYZ53_03910 [Planctomycetes bacterium]|nr:hypothetical protein [Planctomycetota bacterium]
MRGFNPRKTTPRVRSGKVQRKNRSVQSPNCYLAPPPRLDIRRLPAGRGFRHVATRQDVERFIELVPDWAELSRGLHAIVLAPGAGAEDGWHEASVIHVRAWPRELVLTWTADALEEHRGVLERLRVPWRPGPSGQATCYFDERTARGFQLLHILLHELGHHHDRMTSRTGKRPVRGETYAESFARRYEAVLWGRYRQAFGPPERVNGPSPVRVRPLRRNGR